LAWSISTSNYLKDVLTRLPTQLNSRIDELLPHRWKPAT
jgi:transposase